MERNKDESNVSRKYLDSFVVVFFDDILVD